MRVSKNSSIYISILTKFSIMPRTTRQAQPIRLKHYADTE